MKKLFLFIVFIFLISRISFSQGQEGNTILAGGPLVGYYLNSVTDLNNELVKVGFPKISTNGFLTIGGGGFIEVPSLKGLRLGGFGFGFSENQTLPVNTTAVKSQYSVKYAYSGGGITIEYAKMLSKKFDYTIGGAIGIGYLSINLYQHSPSASWSSSSSLWDTVSTSKQLSYSSQTYTFEPRIGIGFQATNFLDFKLNAGYVFSIQNTWKLDDVLEVQNVPSGIKAQGLNINLSMNFGIFIK
jgi:hypothetical protein